VAEADLAPYLERVRDGALRHALEYGVAFLHETQAPAEQEVVNTLFASGAIQARAPVPADAQGLSLHSRGSAVFGSCKE